MLEELKENLRTDPANTQKKFYISLKPPSHDQFYLPLRVALPPGGEERIDKIIKILTDFSESEELAKKIVQVLKSNQILVNCALKHLETDLKQVAPTKQLTHGNLVERLSDADPNNILELRSAKNKQVEQGEQPEKVGVIDAKNVAFGELIGVRFTDAVNFLVYWMITSHGVHNLGLLLDRNFTHVGIQCRCLNPALHQYTAVVIFYGKLKIYTSKNIDPMDKWFGNAAQDGQISTQAYTPKNGSIQPGSSSMMWMKMKNGTVQVNLEYTTIVKQQGEGSECTIKTSGIKTEVSELLSHEDTLITQPMTDHLYIKCGKPLTVTSIGLEKTSPDERMNSSSKNGRAGSSNQDRTAGSAGGAPIPPVPVNMSQQSQYQPSLNVHTDGFKLLQPEP